MTTKLIKQLEMIRNTWVTYKPVTQADKESRSRMLKMLGDQIKECREEFLDHEEDFDNLEMELDLL